MALNQVHLMGRLVAAPELRKTNSDTSVAQFRVAVERNFVNKETNQRDADFINVVAWRGLADFVAQYFTTGDMIVVSGRLQSRTYEDKEGNRRGVLEVVAENCYFGGSKKNGDETSDRANNAPDIGGEDLPF